MPCMCGDPECGSCGPAMGTYADNTPLETIGDLAEYLGADSPRGIPRRIYKDTACGAWIEFLVEWEVPEANNVDSQYGSQWLADLSNDDWLDHPISAVRVGSIVEGSDVEPCVEPFELYFPFSRDDWEQSIESLEREVDARWREVNNYFFQIQYSSELDARGWIEMHPDGWIVDCTYAPGYSKELMEAVESQAFEATDYGTREGVIRVEYGDVATEYYTLVPYYPSGEVIGRLGDEW